MSKVRMTFGIGLAMLIACIPAGATTVEEVVDKHVEARGGRASWESIESMQVRERLSTLRESASRASEHIVSLIAIFVLQTIILPVAFLWIFIEGLKSIAARSKNLIIHPPRESTYNR